ncbi:MAG: hypothetical protein VKL42_02055 [Snowella sp.]|nr:hypothetical protein [Snowella sp.]
MIKVKLFAWAVSPLLLLSLISPPVALAQNNSPSKGTSGTLSGSNPTAGSQTAISVPVTVTAPGAGGFQPVTAVITIVPGTGGAPPTVTVPTTIQTAVNTAGTNAVVTFSTGSLTQTQVATLVSATPTIVASLGGDVPGTITVSTTQGNNTTSSAQATTLGDAATLMTTAVANAPSNGIVVLEVNDITVRISPSNRSNLNSQ